MKGFVYRIYDNTNGNVYYGSTTERYVSNRISKHRASYKRWLKGSKSDNYCSSYDILKNGNYSYNIVEEVEFKIKYELHNRERYYIENNDCINKCIPNRTDKQYLKDNKDKIKEKKKEYYEVNKKQLTKQKKEYYKNNKNIILEKMKETITCDCGCIITKKHLTKHKKTKKHNDLLNKTT
jgi:hypothetical protein